MFCVNQFYSEKCFSLRGLRNRTFDLPLREGNVLPFILSNLGDKLNIYFFIIINVYPNNCNNNLILNFVISEKNFLVIFEYFRK